MNVIYLLIAISNGFYNVGTVTVVERFTVEASCEKTRDSLNSYGSRTLFQCVAAEHVEIK